VSTGYRIRAWGLFLGGYAVTVMYMAVLGLLGNGVVLLVALPALGLVVLGRRSGVIMALLSVLIYLAFTVAAATGILADQLIVRENTLELAQWLGQGLLAGLILAALMALLARFSRVQETALAEAQAATEEMAAARDDLEARMAALDRYTHLLETTAEISRRVARVREGGELLQKAADLLLERLNIEQVAVYSVEQEGGGDGQVAPLPEMPAPVAMVVAQAAGGQGARSEAGIVDGEGPSPGIVLLLRAGGALLAVLHLSGVGPLGQSRTGQVGKEELAALEVMADQLAVALENARLFEEAETRLRDLDALQRHYTVEAWQRFVTERGKAAYHWMPLGPQATGAQGGPESAGTAAEGTRLVAEGTRLVAEGTRLEDTPIDSTRLEGLTEDAWRSLFERAQAEGRPVNLLDEDSGRHLLAMPVRLRDEVIGMLGFHRPRDAGSWQQEEIAAMEVVASRMAFAAENLRLLEDAQRRAARDRLIEEIAGQVQGSLDPDNILKTAVRELGRALEAEWAAIEVTGPGEVETG